MPPLVRERIGISITIYDVVHDSPMDVSRDEGQMRL
jgi:hypothetical protein